MRIRGALALAVVATAAFLLWGRGPGSGERTPRAGSPYGAPSKRGAVETRAMRFSGVVLIDGETAAGATVAARDEAGEVLLGSATTDGKGRFLIAEVRAETVRLDAFAPRGTPATVVVRESREDLLFDLASGIPVRGRVLDSESQPIPGALATAEIGSATANAEGHFKLPPGTRRARIHAVNFVDGLATWSVPLRPVVVHLGAGGGMGGIVRDAEGRSSPGAGVRCGKVQAVADGEGRYLLAGVPVGFLDALMARPAAGVWQEVVPLPEVPVRIGGTTEFDIHLRPGVRVAGMAPAGALVLLESERATTRADSQGRFIFEGVLPGRYSVRLEEGPYQGIHVGSAGLSDIVLVDPGRASLEVRGATREVIIRFGGHARTGTPDAEGRLLFGNIFATYRVSVESGSVKEGPVDLRAGETTVVTLHAPAFVFAGVVEDPDGHALPWAGVALYAEAGHFLNGSRTTADESGRFRLEVGEDSAPFALIVTHDEFTPSVLRGLAESSSRLRPRLGGGVAIDGVVRYDTGEPASGVGVGAHKEDLRWGSWGRDLSLSVGQVLDHDPPRPGRGATCDAAGHFRIEGLVAGTYYVSVGWGEPVQATTGGEPVELVISRPKETESIAGIVVDGEGERIGSAVIQGGEQSTRSDAAGRFRIEGLAPGPHDLLVSRDESAWIGGSFFSATTVRGIVAGREDVVLRVDRGRTLRGRILDAGGQPLPDAEVMLLPPPPPENPAPNERPATPKEKTDADGIYDLRGLPAGPLELAVFHDRHLPLLFEVNESVQEAEEQRLSAGAAVAGVLLDIQGLPAPARMLRLRLRISHRPEELLPWRRAWQEHGPWFRTRTAADGSFRFVGLPAAEYRLELNSGHELLPLSVRSGATELRPQLLPLLTIRGMVVDKAGSSVSKSGSRRLKISAHRGSAQIGYIPVGEDGSFHFAKVPLGRVRLHVIGWEEFDSKELEVDAGDQEVRLQLRRTAPR